MTISSLKKLPAWIFWIFSTLAMMFVLPALLAAQAAPTAGIQAGVANPLPEAPTLTAWQPYSARILGPAADAPASETALVPEPLAAISSRPAKPEQHRFWDRENALLFTATGGMATADFFATHANLAGGGRELNPLTRPFARSTPLLAANFALETAGVIGVSYLFHKTGHHRLERLTSLINIGGSAGAVAYDLAHRR
jgi:hypothetical protein